MAQGADGKQAAAEFEGLVRNFFRRRVADPDDAEDLAQEALCALIESWPRFRGDAAPSTWVWAICRNVMSRQLVTRRRRERAFARLAAEGEEPRRAAKEERLRDAGFIVDALRPAERLLYECHYSRGLPIREISLLLERPEGTIKYQLFMLRRRVRQVFAAEDSGTTEAGSAKPSQSLDNG